MHRVILQLFDITPDSVNQISNYEDALQQRSTDELEPGGRRPYVDEPPVPQSDDHDPATRARFRIA